MNALESSLRVALFAIQQRMLLDVPLLLQLLATFLLKLYRQNMHMSQVSPRQISRDRHASARGDGGSGVYLTQHLH